MLKLFLNGSQVDACTAAKWRLMSSKLTWPALLPGDHLCVRNGEDLLVDAVAGSGPHTGWVDNRPVRTVSNVCAAIRLFVSCAVRRGKLNRTLFIREAARV